MLTNLIMGIKGSVFIAIACWLFTLLLRKEDARWIRGAPTFLAIGIFALGAVAYNVWIYYALLLFLLPWKGKTRGEAVALYPIALNSLPAMAVYLMAGSAVLLPVDKWLVFGIGLLIALLVRPGEKGRTFGYLDLAMILLFALGVIQARGANFTSGVRELTVPFISVAIPYLAVSRNLKTVEDIRRVFLAFAFIGFVLACISVVETSRHWLVYQSLFQTLNLPGGGVSLYLKVRSGLLRSPTSFSESTSFGIFLAFAMMFAVAARDVFKNKRSWLIALGVILLGTVAANSRNAWIAIAVGLLVFDLYRKRYASLATKITLLAVLYGSVMLVAEFSPYVASLAGRSADSAGTLEYRRMLLQRGMEEVRKHPWTGTSLDTALANLEDMKQGEGIIDIVNGYLFYALTAGYLGAVALLGVFVIPLMVMLTKAKSLNFDRRLKLYGGAVAAIAGFSIVTSFFGGFGDRPATFYVITVALGTAILSIKRAKPASTHQATEEVAAEPQLEPA